MHGPPFDQLAPRCGRSSRRGPSAPSHRRTVNNAVPPALHPPNEGPHLPRQLARLNDAVSLFSPLSDTLAVLSGEQRKRPRVRLRSRCVAGTC